jgi:hypothetical protein
MSDADYDEEVDVRDEDSQTPDDYDSGNRVMNGIPMDLQNSLLVT